MRLFDAGKREGEVEEVSDAVLTVPNVLSFLRLCSLPLVYHYLTTDRLGLGLAIGFVFGATDWVDGYVARRFGQVTKLGKLLDPVSDRVFIVVVGFAMVVADLIPLWAVLVVLARDAVILLGGIALVGRGIQPPPVTRIGKTATFVLMWSFPAFILSGFWGGTPEDPQAFLRPLAWVMFLVGVALYYVAAGQYALAVRGQLAAPGGAADGPSAGGSGQPPA